MPDIAEPTIKLVKQWLERAQELETSADRATMDQLEGVVADPDGLQFVMAFVDRVIRPDSNQVAASQLASIVSSGSLPAFLSAIDKILLQAGSRLAPKLPALVMPIARRRLRSIVGHLVAPADPSGLRKHLTAQKQHGYALNVNLLGEAVLGEREAERRLSELLAVLEQPDVDYVSVKISAIASQLNYWAHDDSLRRVSERLALLIDHAATVTPPTFVNVDMEEYHDLELTLDAFIEVLGAPERRHIDAGIVLQAYLPDALPALQRLTAWANERRASGGGVIKVRLVKGANLAMEKVDAAMHGWEQAPFEHKVEVDANYKRCLDWLLWPQHLTGVRLGLASHNLFDIAWTHRTAEVRRVTDKVQFEMLQGMAPAQAATVAEAASDGPPLLLYTPAVRNENFDVAISYLFRRLEENASDDNFLRHLFNLQPDSETFNEQAAIFKKSLELKDSLHVGPRRTQNRRDAPKAAYQIGEAFRNEPDTDPTLATTQRWIKEVLALRPPVPYASITTSVTQIDSLLATARHGAEVWSNTELLERQTILHRVADELANRRGDLIVTMMHEANKTFVEADGEVAEAIDFARYYGDRATDLSAIEGATFSPFGVIGVIPPWNFPVAIPTGGVLSAIAAGNSVVFKPAPETPRCGELVAEACWAGGVPNDVLQFVRTPDDDVGKALITGVDAVILTGGAETADLFRSWKPDMKLFAETSGKNALIITPNADIDLAVADLTQSAFGHSGQKCSAASLAILVGDVYSSDRFRRQLIDAVESIDVGAATRIETTMTPLIGPANDRLARALTSVDTGEQWLVEPTLVDRESNLWTPGVRDGVTAGSWFHQTECFGPVLGLMFAADLDEAIEIQNSSEFGLTGGIHSLDPAEIEQWSAQVQVGNGYVNRPITGAIVQRQPFGGWKRSSIGPGAKAGGPNYVAQLGAWAATAETDDYQAAWESHVALDHDETGLFCEANVFRYRPLERIGVRIGASASAGEVDRIRKAARICGVAIVESDQTEETLGSFGARLDSLGLERVRIVGEVPTADLYRAASDAGTHLISGPVTGAGRVELLSYVREQAMSKTLHRFGNLVGS